MSWIVGFFNFWYDFIVGDDWMTAVVVIAALVAIGLLAHAGGINAWWLLPLVVVAILGVSLWRLTQGTKRG
jgi:hypothetical protein